MVSAESYNLKILLILAVGFALASVLGYITQRLKLSPILGYLLAGYSIGPYSPGYVADVTISEQLAEIGVVLMLFNVGLHLKWKDLLKVKNVAIPGAIVQTAVSAIVGIGLVYAVGWSLASGVTIGLAIGVASTVVLVRVLTDNHLLNTIQGHIAVGWLIVEDILTVFVLVLIPVLASFFSGAHLSVFTVASSVVIIIAKFLLLILFMFTWGHKLVSLILMHVARLRSHELFTLTLLALTFVIATGSALVFGTSIALGAFIAGMIIGQTHVRHQASAHALPMKDAFSVIFFLSVGMIFNPAAILDHFAFFIGLIAIILVIKPLTAYLIVRGLHYPVPVALTIALALAQIGEFSFILCEEALKFHLLPDEGYDIIVSCALISISVNPLLFKGLNYFKPYFKNSGGIPPFDLANMSASKSHKAVIVGFGPIGRSVADVLKKLNFDLTVIDSNVDTIAQLRESNQRGIFGDASQLDLLKAAHVEEAALLVITIPEVAETIHIIQIARQLNSKIKIVARAQYISEQEQLTPLQINAICFEEEAKNAFTQAAFQLAKQVRLG
ncbi:cation:proton antiporter [Candidatus Protochlamydia phocaeensis]|uniref:cation:proton antiporter n=1 Tax=Candidatus Protochlamydia phocaeensis TaxID=1414722 RepID=UPI0009ACFAA2|nr:cation:proton antiporter [Candidatus Protochlamydia phocaeensis]